MGIIFIRKIKHFLSFRCEKITHKILLSKYFVSKLSKILNYKRIIALIGNFGSQTQKVENLAQQDC
jgi:hypothetical protein